MNNKEFLISLCEMVLNGTIDHDHKQACNDCIQAIEVIDELEKQDFTNIVNEKNLKRIMREVLAEEKSASSLMKPQGIKPGMLK